MGCIRGIWAQHYCNGGLQHEQQHAGYRENPACRDSHAYQHLYPSFVSRVVRSDAVQQLRGQPILVFRPIHRNRRGVLICVVDISWITEAGRKGGLLLIIVAS